MLEYECLVIWYDGNEHKADIRKSVYPDSSMPHNWDLPDDAMIIAVIQPTGGMMNFDVFIMEDNVFSGHLAAQP